MAMDCWDKRGRKGYLFLSGDETPYSAVKKAEVKRIFGIVEEGDIPLAEIFDEVKEKFHVFFILPKGTSHWNDPRITDTWRKYLGQNVLKLEDPEAICELIATTIAINEGVDLDSALKDLADVGATKASIGVVSKALAKVSPDGDGSGKAVKKAAKATGDIPKGGTDSVKRL
jgi:hypothetical protein